MATRSKLLVFCVNERRCAVPATVVSEIMRPLPTEKLTQAPGFVLGIVTIRGRAVPLVDLGMLVWTRPVEQMERMVVLKVGSDRWVAAGVSEVSGLVEPRNATVDDALPPLIQDDSAHLSALGRLDNDLLHVLELSCLVPDEAWATIAAAKRPHA